MKRLLNKRDVGMLLGISDRMVAYLVERGQLPAPIKVGRLSKWPEERLDEWLSEKAGQGIAGKKRGRPRSSGPVEI